MVFERISALVDRTPFPRIVDPEAEAHKLAILRIATGLLLVWRCALMARDSYFYFEPTAILGLHLPAQFLVSCFELLLGIGLAVGVAPSVCALLLMLTHPAYSIWTGTYNLAPMLLMPVLGGLAFLQSGRLTIAGSLRPVSPAAHFRAFYLLLLVAFAAWNFQALLYHLKDSYWIEGRTSAVLFNNSYLSEFYPVFRRLESWSPDFFWAGSIAVGVLQSIFQFGMLPLASCRAGLRFVFIWGGIFIVGSLIDLELSILPLVEVIFWIAIFVPAQSFPGFRRPAAPRPGDKINRLHAIGFSFFAGGYSVLLAMFFINAATGSLFDRRLPSAIENTVFFYSGLVAPNVFNREDLTMGDRWPVIEWHHAGKIERVPFNGPEGERLRYHRSDLLYFGNSLRWRRGMIDVKDLEAYHRPGGEGYEYARLLTAYDYRRSHRSETGTYHVILFRNRGSDHTDRYNPGRFLPVEVLSFDVPPPAISP